MQKWAKNNPKLDFEIKKRPIELYKLDVSRIHSLKNKKHDKLDVQKYRVKNQGKNCTSCQFAINLPVFKKKRSRPNKWVCLALNWNKPKELVNISCIPNWCPLNDTYDISLPICLSCKRSLIRLQLKRELHLITDCKKNLITGKIREYPVSCFHYEEEK